MRYAPQGNTKGARALMLLLFAQGIVLFSMNIPYPSLRSLWLSLACAFFMGSAFVFVRYVGTALTYEIAMRGYLPPEDGVEYARLGLDELVYFDLYPRRGGKEREVHKKYPRMKLYNYTASLIPERVYIAVFVDVEGNEAGLILEPDAAMAAYLARIAGE